MTDAQLALAAVPEASHASRKWIVYAGRLALAAALVGAWDYGARTLGPLFFAPPREVLQRIGELAQSGQMVTDILATMRVSAAGFAIAAVAVCSSCSCCGARRATWPSSLTSWPRWHPQICVGAVADPGSASATCPLVVRWWCSVFITTFAGIRGVDQRLSHGAHHRRERGHDGARLSGPRCCRSSPARRSFPRAVSATTSGKSRLDRGVGLYRAFPADF
jgi:hypothetical protein